MRKIFLENLPQLKVRKNLLENLPQLKVRRDQLENLPQLKVRKNQLPGGISPQPPCLPNIYTLVTQT